MKKILLFGIHPDKKIRLKTICLRIGADIFEIAPCDYNQQLGYLAGRKGFVKSPIKATGLPLPKEMMVFEGFDSDDLDVFLEAYKKEGLAPIALKAVVTPVNANWTAMQLSFELIKEHASI